MARDEITITLGDLDASKRVNVATVTPQAVTVANGIKLKDAAGAKYESIWICVNNSGSAADVIVKAGNAYPNNLLGDLSFKAGASGVTPFQIADYACFLNKDGSINIDFETGFNGTIYAIGQRAGIKTVES